MVILTIGLVECVAMLSGAAPFAFAGRGAALVARRTAIAVFGVLVTMFMTDWSWRIGSWSAPALVLLAFLAPLGVWWCRALARGS